MPLKLGNIFVVLVISFILVSVCGLASSAEAGTVTGNIDGIINGNTVSGWACQTGNPNSILVDLYLVKPEVQGGIFIGQYPANMASEPAVASACQSTGTNYRYQIVLTSGQQGQLGQLQEFAGKNVYVYGVDPNSRTLYSLAFSGWFAIPDPNQPEVWFMPPDRMFSGSPTETEYMKLFANPPGLYWPNAFSHFQVLDVPIYNFFAAPAADMQQMAQMLKANNRKLAIAEGAALSTYNASTNTGCGIGEGYNTPAQAQADVNKLQSLGIVPDILIMDEPLWFGHYDKNDPSSKPCNWSIPQVISQSVTIFNIYKNAFPNIRLDNAEPISTIFTASSTWLSDLQQWVGGFKSAGTPIFSLHDDPDWRTPLNTYLPQFISMLNTQGTIYGIYFTGDNDGSVNSDLTWMQAAEQHIQTFNASGNGRPGVVEFASWDPYPLTVVPDNNPAALSYLIAYYFSSYGSEAPPQPFMRLFDSYHPMDYFLTSNLNTVKTMLTQGWVLQPLAGYIYPPTSGMPGLTPLYQLWHPIYGYFYTTDPNEKNYAIQIFGFSDQGIAGEVYPNSQPAPGSAALYRLFNKALGRFFYTTSVSELNNFIALGWQSQGTQCYLPHSTPLYNTYQRVFAPGGLTLSSAQGPIPVADTGTLNMQGDGNLVLYNSWGTGLWSTQTNADCVSTTCQAVFQSDGSLVLFRNGVAFWSSATAGASALVFSAQIPYMQIYNSANQVVLASSYYDPASFGPFQLKTNQNILINGNSTGSPNLSLTMGGDGNLVANQATSSGGWIPVWSSGTSGQNCSAGCTANFQGDGNFVLYNGSTPYWSTFTYGNAGAKLRISTKFPYLEIINTQGQVLWSS